MSNQTNLFLLTLIATILLSSSYAVGSVFADSDDDQHDGKVDKKNRVWTGDGPPNSKLGKVGDLYVDNHNNIYNLYKKTAKNTWTDIPDIQGTPGAQGPKGDTGSTGQQGTPGAQGPKGDTGSTGQQGFVGAEGTPGQNGQNGISCWDTNGNAHNDSSEDINGDSLYNGLDCQGPQGEPGSNTDVTDLQNQINSLITQINHLNSQFQSVQKTLCNDHDPFTTDMISPATNLCVHTTVICDDNNPVTSDIYDPSSEQCLNLECDDNDPSTFDTAVNLIPPQCGHLPIQTCDDNNPYTTDTYVGSSNTCQFESLPYGTPCDDGDIFTVNDTVQYGQCTGQVIDIDNDGFYIPFDCDDTDPAVNPTAPEVFNGIDDNCNVVVDEGVTDADFDGWISELDCDDHNAFVNPVAVDVFNGLDDNCNGIVDDGITDADSDGYPSTVDCDDTNASVNPAATEVSSDGIDNNCNGIVDEDMLIFFEDDFSDNSAGWILGPTWQIGSATTSPSIIFNPDPAQDNTPTNDNGIAGVVIGGNAPTQLHSFYYLESPVIDTASATGPVILEYSRWLNSDYDPYMHNQVQVYNGHNWITVWQSDGPPGIFDNSWTQHTFDITAFKSTIMKVRFGYDVTDVSAFSISGWNLDDIKISTP